MGSKAHIVGYLGVMLVLGLALVSAGGSASVASGYAPGAGEMAGGHAALFSRPLVLKNGPADEEANRADTPMAWDRSAGRDTHGTDEHSLSAMAPAATFDVACGDVYGPSGLIAAIGTANGNGEDDVINLAAECVYTLLVQDNDTDGPNGLPSILADGGHRVTINGNGATIQRSSDVGIPAFRILHVSSGANLTLNDLIVKNGRTVTEAGGGIFNAGALTLDDSTVRDNTTGDGG